MNLLPTGISCESDPLRQLVPLRKLLQAKRSLQELESLRPRLILVETAVLAQLLEATAPLSPALRILAQALSVIYGLWHAQLGNTANPVVKDLCSCLLKQFLLAQITHSTPPRDLWPAIITLAKSEEDAKDVLRTLLALTVIHPESYTPRALWFLGEFLQQEGKLISLRQTPPDPNEGWHWMDSLGNVSATNLRLSRPTGTSQLLFFQCAGLATRIDALLQELGHQPDHPLYKLSTLVPAEVQNTLRRAAEQWHTPASRRYNRRRQDSRATLCTRLDQLWSALGNSAEDAAEISDWMIINESAGGYALMHASGPVTDLVAGHALGLKLAGKPWSLCLVRWIRSENSAHVELGIELLSPQAIPVRLTLPGREPQPAFLMPALAGLEQKESLLAPREEWGEEHNFVLLTESAGQLRITPCLRGTPRHQTSVIEVFEFQRIGFAG